MEPVGEAPVGEVPVELYTKLRKTRTSEMDVLQKILIGKFPNLGHVIFTNGCLYHYHSISAIWATTNKTILFYPGCVNMQKYDHIMDRSSNKVGLLHTSCIKMIGIVTCKSLRFIFTMSWFDLC